MSRQTLYDRIPRSLQGALEALRGRDYLNVGYATHLSPGPLPGEVSLIHHRTAIVVWHVDGSATVTTAGYYSPTTYRRINAALRGWSVGTTKGVPFWHKHDPETGYHLERFHEFEDGDRVYPGTPAVYGPYEATTTA